MKFANHYNMADYPVQLEENHLPSETIPDQVLPITEILKRFASGLPVYGKEPIWEGEDDINEGIDPLTLDLSERMDLISYRKQELADLKDKLTVAKLAKSLQNDSTMKLTESQKKSLSDDQDQRDENFKKQLKVNNKKNNNDDDPPS